MIGPAELFAAFTPPKQRVHEKEPDTDVPRSLEQMVASMCAMHSILIIANRCKALSVVKQRAF
jgi:hypothetical protein